LKVIQSRLPQELREMVYEELLTEHMMHEMATCASPTAYAYPLNHGTFLYKPTPRFLNPRLMDSSFMTDIVKVFYRKYSGFEVKHPLRIATLLQRDLFKLGYHIKPANCLLRALTVDGCLLSDNKHFIDVKLLPLHFAPLFHAQQRLATGFHLTVRLWTDGNSIRSSTDYRNQGMALRCILQALKPIFAKLVEKQSTATHSVILEVARKNKQSLDMALAETSPNNLSLIICKMCCKLQKA
jgi:hypothetical protein